MKSDMKKSDLKVIIEEIVNKCTSKTIGLIKNVSIHSKLC